MCMADDDLSAHRPDGIRLQKVLAQAGVASRRAGEELIADGRVTSTARSSASWARRVDPETAVVHVDGERIILREDLVYLALNKPRGVLSHDVGRPGPPLRRRPASAGLAARTRLFHVGRLDADTEGLLLLTNDGELGHRLMHPSLRGAQDLPGRGARARSRATSAGGCATASSSRTARRRSTAFQPGRHARGPARWSSWSCTRAASTSSGGCWPRSATRCCGSCAPQIGRVLLGDQQPGARGRHGELGAAPAGLRTVAAASEPETHASERRRAQWRCGAPSAARSRSTPTTRDDMLAGSAELVTAVLERNELVPDDIISIIFTATPT